MNVLVLSVLIFLPVFLVLWVGNRILLSPLRARAKADRTVSKRCRGSEKGLPRVGRGGHGDNFQNKLKQTFQMRGRKGVPRIDTSKLHSYAAAQQSV